MASEPKMVGGWGGWKGALRSLPKDERVYYYFRYVLRREIKVMSPEEIEFWEKRMEESFWEMSKREFRESLARTWFDSFRAMLQTPLAGLAMLWGSIFLNTLMTHL